MFDGIAAFSSFDQSSLPQLPCSSPSSFVFVPVIIYQKKKKRFLERKMIMVKWMCRCTKVFNYIDIFLTTFKRTVHKRVGEKLVRGKPRKDQKKEVRRTKKEKH